MSRPARGIEVLEMAQEMIRQAKTVDELRQAQAVVLPLAYGLSLDQTARAIGQSVTWTCRLRNRFLAGETVGDGQRQHAGGRRRENLSADREREVLAPFLARASAGGILVVPQIKAELEAAMIEWAGDHSARCILSKRAALPRGLAFAGSISRCQSRAVSPTGRTIYARIVRSKAACCFARQQVQR